MPSRTRSFPVWQSDGGTWPWISLIRPRTRPTRGGVGVVLEAFDSRLQRNVALKVLDPELAGDQVARQRFCREARAAASITHENVVAVHQVEKSGESALPYLVMQLI